ncbi:MAG: purine-binding chemotaxis protein CheW [Chlorobia bacterium]|nr:purine-binding chemotaxis protein CheW [Fimbriimonadaceae bacterium]
MAESKYVIFKLGNERYGLPIESVEQILPAQQLTKVAKAPKVMLGVFELRGKSIPTIDTRLRLELPEGLDSRNFVLVFTENGRCALRVDHVEGIVAFQEEEIDGGARLLNDKIDEVLSGVAKRGEELTVLLDPMRLVPKQLKPKVEKAA